MAIQFIAQVLDDPYFGPSQKTELLVAIAIADRARKSDGRAWPSIESLAARARTSVRGVQDACKALQKAGKLRVVPGGGVNGTNAYYLLFDPAAAAPRPPQPLRGGGCNEAPEEAAAQVPDEAAAQAAEEAPVKAPPDCTQTVRNRQDPSGIRQEPPGNAHEHTPLAPPAGRRECVLAGPLNGFEEFWKIYPAKYHKGDAEKEWRAGGCADVADRILQSLHLAVQQERWRMDGGRYIPFPAKWLRVKGWEDDPTPTSYWRRGNPLHAAPRHDLDDDRL